MKNPYITKVDNNELIGSTRYYFNPNKIDIIWNNSNSLFKSVHRHINSSLHGILIKKQIWKQK
jgi:hypothetical protein